jgi:hypothetical protein
MDINPSDPSSFESCIISELKKMRSKDIVKIIHFIDSSIPSNIIKNIVLVMEYDNLYTILENNSNIQMSLFRIWLLQTLKNNAHSSVSSLSLLENADKEIINAQRRMTKSVILTWRDNEEKERRKNEKIKKDKPSKEELNQESMLHLLKKIDLEADIDFPEVDFTQAQKEERALEEKALGPGFKSNKPYVAVTIPAEEVPNWFTWLSSLLLGRMA